jgi:hypothetical protein
MLLDALTRNINTVPAGRAIAFFMPRFAVDRDGLRGVEMASVDGWRNVPVRAIIP